MPRAAVSIAYRCKCCSKTHLSPTQVFQEAAFLSLQMQSYFDNTRYFCPSSGNVKTYSYDDHYWINEAMLPKLCAYVTQFLEENGIIDQLLHHTDGELLPPDEQMNHLPPPRNALPSGMAPPPGSRTGVTPRIDHSPLRKMMAG